MTESKEPVKKNVGPGGIYDLHIEERVGDIPVRVWRLNERGKRLRERLLEKEKELE